MRHSFPYNMTSMWISKEIVIEVITSQTFSFPIVDNNLVFHMVHVRYILIGWFTILYGKSAVTFSWMVTPMWQILSYFTNLKIQLDRMIYEKL